MQDIVLYDFSPVPDNEGAGGLADMKPYSNRIALLQGTLDLLILKVLVSNPVHGMGISHMIEQLTMGAFCVKPGSLFPALHRMETAGWLVASWAESEDNRRAKYYSLTKAGRCQLKSEKRRWEQISTAIERALQAGSVDKQLDSRRNAKTRSYVAK
jgi:PadR family transcriptional regulator PadR